MAGSFGGAVKLTGEAEYRQALAKITQNLREVGSEMKLVSSQYAKTDTSQEALSAQTDVLTKKLEQQKAKLAALQGQERAMNAQYTASNTAHQKLTASLEAERQKLSQIEAEHGKGSAAYQAQAKVVAQLSTDVDKSTAAVNSNEIAMSKMRQQINQAQADINKTDAEIKKLSPDLNEAGNNANNLGKNVQESGEKAEKAGDGFTVFKGVLANLATSAIQSAVEGLKNVGSALVDIGKQAFESYSSWEQLTGGIETLFGAGGMSLEQYAASVGKTVDQAKGKYDELDAAQTTVLQNANNAYKTAGMSANEYMDQVTKFSASLIQSLGGDTKKAADYANVAITDMSDNANKMGTSIQDIQNAYQGFAKGNYTMLDNLRLGYGGTAEEMKRLIQDASKMTDVQKQLGVTVDASSMSFDNIVNAIHVMQGSLNISGLSAEQAAEAVKNGSMTQEQAYQAMGTTAKEAATTIEGSVNAMKASWSNLLTELAVGDDLSSALDPFIDSLKTVVDNALPIVEQVIISIGDLAYSLVTDVLPGILADVPSIIDELGSSLMDTVNALMTAVFTAMPDMMGALGQIVPNIAQAIIENFPMLLSVALQLVETLVDGIAQALPTLIGMLPTLINETITALMEELPLILNAGLQLIMGLAQGIIQALPQLYAMLPTIIQTVVGGILEMLPQLLESGVQMLLSLINGLLEALPQLIAMLPTIISTTTTVLLQHLPEIISAGFQILIGLINGIMECLPQLIAMLPTIISTFVTVITQNLPTILKLGATMIGKLILGIGSLFSNLRQEVWKIIPLVVNELKELPGKMKDIGGDLIKGLWNGIKDMGSWIKDKIGGFCSGVVDNIKGFFGIHSPSRVMRDQVGTYLAQGIGVGFEDEMSDVTKQMQQAMPSTDAFAQSYDFGSVSAAQASSSVYRGSQSDIVSAITEALKGVQVVLDDEVAGRFVTKTVTAAIYR